MKDEKGTNYRESCVFFFISELKISKWMAAGRSARQLHKNIADEICKSKQLTLVKKRKNILNRN